ncbi:hypothetical protein BMB171_C0246 [Bacillus thuringiensis BMB171]|nr:hypothetical protein BMB171_C0246 [Bacillus thuringiensis BMB171]
MNRTICRSLSLVINLFHTSPIIDSCLTIRILKKRCCCLC